MDSIRICRDFSPGESESVFGEVMLMISLIIILLVGIPLIAEYAEVGRE